MDSKPSPRRRFLKNASAMAALAVGAQPSASAQAPSSRASDARSMDLRAYGERSRFEQASRSGSLGLWPPAAGPTRDYGFRTPLQNSVGIITPPSLHFIISHGDDPPDIDPSQHRLLIHGMVDRPLIFTPGRIERLPSVSRLHFLECHGNSAMSSPNRPLRMAETATVQDTHGLTSCSEWTGVLLSVLLKEAGVQKGASWLLAEGADAIKHTKSIPLDKATEDVLVAYGQNGEPAASRAGLPVTAAGARLARHWQCEVAEADQGGGPALHGHDGNHQVPQPQTGWQVALVRIRARTEIGDHTAFRRTKAARPRILRDHRSGLVRRGRRPARGSIHRWRADLEGRAASKIPSLARRIRDSEWTGIGTEQKLCCNPAAPTNGARFSPPSPNWRRSGE